MPKVTQYKLKNYSESTLRNWYDSYVDAWNYKARNNIMEDDKPMSFDEYKRSRNAIQIWPGEYEKSGYKSVNEFLVRRGMYFENVDKVHSAYKHYLHCVQVAKDYARSNSVAADWLSLYSGVSFTNFKKSGKAIMEACDIMVSQIYYTPT